MTAFADYYRCLPDDATFGTQGDLSTREGFFAFGDAIGFGRLSGAMPAEYAGKAVVDVLERVTFAGGRPCLPFDLSAVATNLREERYRQNGHNWLQTTGVGAAARRLYYAARPFLGVAVRRHLQKASLRDWKKIAFPRWPVDRSVDQLMERAMLLSLQAQGKDRIPFIWFWPDGASAAAMMTHDIEGDTGLAYCDTLMGLDDEAGIKSAFQLIPEERPEAWRRTADRLRARGFEVNLHDLNHDGQLFSNREDFTLHARRLNSYAREFRCDGFRSGAMYREQSWFEELEFAYDMSVPNAAHLEPQRGGCCTVMPYFIGRMLELPLTTAQDYTQFFILNDYGLRLWKEQVTEIRRSHGLISVIAHPDYLTGSRERSVYIELLRHLVSLRSGDDVWIALPAEINRWWRDRQEMKLVKRPEGWVIEGPQSHRARLAYATRDGDRIGYLVEPARAAAASYAVHA